MLKDRRQPLLLALLVLVAAVAFLPAVTSSFVADDFILLRTLDRYSGIGWAFSHNDIGAGTGAGHFYRPLWVLWHAVIDRLSGAAWAFHAGNLVLYVAITLEVWLLGRRLLGSRSAWVAAFAFAVYPRHGESVAWISGSTDLVAAVLALPAVLCALTSWRPGVRAGAAAGFAAAAVLSKESAFVLPLLAAVAVWAARGPRPRRWAAPVAMAVAQAVVLVVRFAVVGGLGGYADYPWTPLRFAVGLGSYVLAALSPPQLELLRDPALLIVPLAALLFVLFAVRALRRRGEGERLRLAAAGGAWFAIALLPALNLAVDLNTANGERLLFLPSVGLALAFGALFPVRSRATLVSLAAAGAAALALSLLSAQTWNPASDLAERVVTQAAALGPPDGELVAVTVPEEYRNAHVFPGVTLAVALQRRRPDLRVAPCVPLIVRSKTAGAVRVSRRADGGFDVRTTWDVPVDVPVLRDPSPVIADCLWDAADGWPPGVELEATAHSTPLRQPAAVGYFDGRDFVNLP